MSEVSMDIPERVTDDLFPVRAVTLGNRSTEDREKMRHELVFDLTRNPILVVIDFAVPSSVKFAGQQLEVTARQLQSLWKHKFLVWGTARPNIHVRVQEGLDHRVTAMVKDVFGRAGLSAFMFEPQAKIQDVPADKQGAEIYLDRTELDRLFPARPNRPTYFSQPTVVHEFGHMLGLPDEYICMTAPAGDAMKRHWALTPDEIANWRTVGQNLHDRAEWKAGAGATWDAKIRNLYFGGRRYPHAVLNQKRYVDLCAKADLAPPEFGRVSLSLMSGGKVFLKQHGVTIWECLCRMTEMYLDPKEWAIDVVNA